VNVLVPESGSVPLQLPAAVQAVVFVEVHVSVTLPPDAMEVEEAANVSVGAVVGVGIGVVPATICCTVPATMPFRMARV